MTTKQLINELINFTFHISCGVPGVFKCPYPGRTCCVRCPDCSSLDSRIVTFQFQLKLRSSAIRACVVFQPQAVTPTLLPEFQIEARHRISFKLPSQF